MQHIGLIGLGTMGANLARNAVRNGATVSIFNRTEEKTDAFMQAYGSEGKFIPCSTIQEFVQSIPTPRSIILMVNAGQPVDDVMQNLMPSLNQGDALIDAGNSHFTDTERRIASLASKGILFLGMGVSGGEEGALLGPSMMPGGSREAFDRLEPLFNKMAAKDGAKGKCVAFMGTGGAGHFVKMVHNGIEYGMMQLIAEAYDLLRSAGRTNGQMAALFAKWNKEEDLSSFLLEITAEILKKKEGKNDLIDLIKDVAKQKGTGKWTTEAAMECGAAIPTINAAVDMRILSGDTNLRAKGALVLPEMVSTDPAPATFDEQLRGALTLAIISAYQQGFRLMERVSEAKEWKLPFPEIARIWRGGCIIRSRYLENVEQAYRTKEVHPTELQWLQSDRQTAWREVIAYGVRHGIPLPGFASSLAYYDGIRRRHLPQNIIQAQRDFFGAHGFERTDKPGTFHGDWKNLK